MSDEVVGTPKNDFWENIVLPNQPDLVPGTYVSPTIRVGANGLVLEASDGQIRLPVVENVASLSTITNPPQGLVAVVLNEGSGNTALYVYKLTPSPDWYQLTVPSAIGTIQKSFTFGTGFPYIIGQAYSTSNWKRFTITITTAFTAGTGFSIIDNGSNVLMPSNLIDATVPGVYEYEIPGNVATAGANNQLILARSGSPSAGAGVVYVEYVN